ncbi:4'-phosphopantetheinyl transferase superfamily protein [Streptomyces sp. NPDC046215]|uniref:Holo-[acyl-carrier-protein] synthase n=1 Tax=Streptomyces stramineus TaxID=173861 RepID=A0ABN1ART6_9ACTN
MLPGQVGIDLVPFSRVRAMLAGSEELLTTRMLTPREHELCYPGRTPDVPGIAGRLAAKEAVFKLFRADRGTLPWQGIEILRGSGGWPEVHLAGRAAHLARDARIEHIDVSIAHDEPCAIAIAYVART